MCFPFAGLSADFFSSYKNLLSVTQSSWFLLGIVMDTVIILS